MAAVLESPALAVPARRVAHWSRAVAGRSQTQADTGAAICREWTVGGCDPRVLHLVHQAPACGLR